MSNMFECRKKNASSGGGGVPVDSVTITSTPYTSLYVVGDTLDLTGLQAEASITPFGTADVTSYITTQPAQGTVLSTVSQPLPVAVNYYNASASFDINVYNSVLDAWDSRGLEYNSWGLIQKVAQSEYASELISVGDTKSFVVNGNTYHAEVVAINDGTGDAGAWYPAHTIDFVSMELYSGTSAFLSSNVREGFPTSLIRNFLDSVYLLLSPDLRNVILDKTHLYNIDTNGTMNTASTKLWLPTHYEVFGNEPYGSIEFPAINETSQNNKQYILTRIKRQIGASYNHSWWTSSMCTFRNNMVLFMEVESSGQQDYASYSEVNLLPICFRIG